MAAKVLHGARAQLIIDGKVRGIFNNVSYGVTYDVQPIFILGRHSPVETVYTAQEPVQVTASGWRVLDHGAHVEAMLPKLQELLQHEYIELAIFDRQSTDPQKGLIAKIHSCRPTGFNTNITARQPEEISVSFIGLLVDDESTENSESVGASDLP